MQCETRHRLVLWFDDTSNLFVYTIRICENDGNLIEKGLRVFNCSSAEWICRWKGRLRLGWGGFEMKIEMQANMIEGLASTWDVIMITSCIALELKSWSGVSVDSQGSWLGTRKRFKGQSRSKVRWVHKSSSKTLLKATTLSLWKHQNPQSSSLRLHFHSNLSHLTTWRLHLIYNSFAHFHFISVLLITLHYSIPGSFPVSHSNPAYEVAENYSAPQH